MRASVCTLLTLDIAINYQLPSNELHFSQGKLELITGAMTQSMDLELYDKENKLICKLENDDASLRAYNVSDGMRLHVSIYCNPKLKLE